MANNNNETISIFEFADNLAKLNPHFTSRKKKCREALLGFMSINNYFGLQKMDFEEYSIRQSEVENIRPNLELWLRSYGLGSDEKLKLLTDRMIIIYPETGALFSEFREYVSVK